MPKWVTKATQLAYCEECDKYIGCNTNGLGVAARHHTATGHHVRVQIDRAVIFCLQQEIDQMEKEHAHRVQAG
jgi:hypothetical protein